MSVLENDVYSNIFQCDGADTVSETSGSEYSTEDEAYTEREAAVLVPAAAQPPAGQPLVLEVDETGTRELPASLPLVMLTNARSLYNKVDNFKKWLLEVFPDCAVISESWEGESRRLSLQDLLAGTPYKVHSYRRPRGRSGGGCAVIFNEARFKVEKINVNVEAGLEVIWVIMTPKILDHKLQRIKRICVGSVYIAPRSVLKSETISHIIQTIHYVRSIYDNQVSFLIAGDINRTDYTDIIDSYGALKQCVTVGTRKQATLEVILSDLINLYHPPTTKPPCRSMRIKKGPILTTI